MTLEQFTSSYGQTPIDADAREYLQPELAQVATNSELDRLEALNIADAMSWVLDQPWVADKLLTSASLREIHRHMFGDVWTWAGKYRVRDVNIGNCPADQVAVRLEQILGNFAYQISAGRSASEVCPEYHQALTQVHPFVNGNGRHARLTTELLASSLGEDEAFINWGASYPDRDERRSAYLAALRAADQGDFESLSTFMFA